MIMNDEYRSNQSTEIYCPVPLYAYFWKTNSSISIALVIYAANVEREKAGYISLLPFQKKQRTVARPIRWGLLICISE